MQNNIEKLKARYPNGFSSEASVNRVETTDTAQADEEIPF